MSILVKWSALLMIVMYLCGAPTASAEQMRFYRASTGGNCVTCTWIAAVGEIEPETYLHFFAFLESNDLLDARGLAIHLHSPGGDLLGGIRLGLAFRQQQVNTAISFAERQKIYQDGTVIVGESLPSRCSSACAFAFLGGVSRFASRTTPPQDIGFQRIGQLGVHQFYDQKSIEDPSKKLLNAQDRIYDQQLISTLLSYLSDMGVSAEILQIAASTPPSTMRHLSEDELRRTRVDNRMVQAVFINGYHNGVGITEVQYQRSNAKYRLEIYCEHGSMQILASIEHRGFYDAAAHKEWGIFQNIFLNNGTPVKLISQKFEQNENGSIFVQALFDLGEASLDELIQKKAFIFEDNTSRYASNEARFLSFVLPNDYDGLYLLPRTCFGG